MPPLRSNPSGRGPAPGGVVGYPVERVYQEVAYLGQHVHWTLEELMSLDHVERQRWVQEVLSLAEVA
jgi:hypothetical protein